MIAEREGLTVEERSFSSPRPIGEGSLSHDTSNLVLPVVWLDRRPIDLARRATQVACCAGASSNRRTTPPHSLALHFQSVEVTALLLRSRARSIAEQRSGGRQTDTSRRFAAAPGAWPNTATPIHPSAFRWLEISGGHGQYKMRKMRQRRTLNSGSSRRCRIATGRCRRPPRVWQR